MTRRLTVIGAGLAGLSAAYHHGHNGSVIFEKNKYIGGHVHVREHSGCVWDDGPHISFTRDEYVRDLFAEAVQGEFYEFDVRVSNYYHGWFVDHPAHVALHQVPEPLRSHCLRSFLSSRADSAAATEPKDYREWLYRQFGPVYANAFPAAYTRKYWTVEPEELAPDFVGNRLGTPDVDVVKAGAEGPLPGSHHYVTTSRYPKHGGYIAYASKLAEGSNVELAKRVEKIDFGTRWIGFSDGSEHGYEELVSTMPLPELIAAGVGVPMEVREAAAALKATELYLVELVADHPLRRDEHWIYVYDLDKYATRISFMNRWSPNNAPQGTSAIQVEYYGSSCRPLPRDRTAFVEKVIDELVEIGCLDSRRAVTARHVHHIPHANVIFDLNRASSLEVVNAYLDEMEVLRAGRFGRWLYSWTDDAVLDGKAVAEAVRG